jgi:hypothetical protein
VVAVAVDDVLPPQVRVQRRVAAVLGVREGKVLPLVEAAAPVLVRQQERGLRPKGSKLAMVIARLTGQPAIVLSKHTVLHMLSMQHYPRVATS